MRKLGERSLRTKEMRMLGEMRVRNRGENVRECFKDRYRGRGMCMW